MREKSRHNYLFFGPLRKIFPSRRGCKKVFFELNDKAESFSIHQITNEQLVKVDTYMHNHHAEPLKVFDIRILREVVDKHDCRNSTPSCITLSLNVSLQSNVLLYVGTIARREQGF